MNLGASTPLLIMILSAVCLAATSSPTPTPTWNGTSMYGDAYSPAIGAWLPTIASWNVVSRKGPTRISQRDGFTYENERPESPQRLGFQGPEDGTKFRPQVPGNRAFAAIPVS